MTNKSTRKTERDDIASITARICGVSDNYVRKIVKGDRSNDKIFDTYMELKERKSKLIEEIERKIKI